VYVRIDIKLTLGRHKQTKVTKLKLPSPIRTILFLDFLLEDEMEASVCSRFVVWCIDGIYCHGHNVIDNPVLER